MARTGTVRSLHRGDDPYPVLQGRGLLARSGPLMRRIWEPCRVAVVTHRRLAFWFRPPLTASLRQMGYEPSFLYIGEGESAKSLDTAQFLYERLIRLRFSREDGIVALGGGVVGDTAGFVASTYLRGIPWVQIPTTLLAQIDSAVGAKVAVNHPKGKNLIGAFHRPSAVWIDPTVLSSLPQRQFRSGVFEMLKCGLVGSPPLFRLLERGVPGALDRRLDRAIALSVRTKLAVVREDERESGFRRKLNLGHTIGHGLEAAGEYRHLTHGEAVGWGMIAAARLAQRRGLIGNRLLARMERAVRNVAPLPSLRNLDSSRVLQAIDLDKKAGRQGLRFVLPVAIGEVTVIEAFPREELLWALSSLGVGRGH